MAVFNYSVVLTAGGGTVAGPNVSPGDSITLTATANGFSGTASAVNPVNCLGIDVTLGVAKPNAIASFSGSSYSIGYVYTQDGTTFYTASIEGNVGTLPDNTPNPFDLPNVSNAVPGEVTYSIPQTITGMDSGTSCSVSGAGSPQLQVAGGSNPWVTSSTINPGQTIDVRLTASSLFSTSRQATLVIGTVSDTITVTTAAEPSSGTGGPISGGTGTYGIQVFDTNGITSVLSPSTRFINRLTDPTSVSIPSNGGSVLIPCIMTGLTTSNSTVVFSTPASANTATTIVITLESNGFRITNNDTQGTFTNIVYAVRF